MTNVDPDSCASLPSFPYFSGAATIPTDTATYTYDNVGNLLTADNGDARIKRSYYPNGALKTDTLRIRTYSGTDFTAHVYGLSYEYDLAGNRTVLGLPTNLGTGCTVGVQSTCKQTYHYNTYLNALDTLTSLAGQKYTFAYDDNGRPTSRTAPGGVSEAWTYDADDRVIRRLEKRNTTTTVHSDTIRYDARGKKLRIATTVLSGLDQVSQHAYSVAGFLAASEYSRVTPDTLKRTDEWTLDALGNATAYVKNRNLSATKSGTNSVTDNELTQKTAETSGTTVFANTTYANTNGFVLGQWTREWDVIDDLPQPTGNSYVATQSYFSGDRKLRAFQRAGADTSPQTRLVVEEYRYDALGRRVYVRSRGRASCTASYCKAAVERTIWDGAQVLMEIRVPGDSGLSSTALEVDTASGAHYGRVAYVHAGGIDAPLALDRNGTIIIPHANDRGLHDAGSDTTGAAYTTNINWIGAERTPLMDNPSPMTANGWAGSLITSQQDQSGLMFRRNRYYDPQTGRFTQADPIGFAGGPNQFGFASGDPVNRFDPFGLSDLIDDDWSFLYDGSFNVDVFAEYLTSHAEQGPNQRCAYYVRQALCAAGLEKACNAAGGGWPVPAKDYGAFLERLGFKQVGIEGYDPQKGDIAVFNYGLNGHITGYNGKNWVSDFVQNQMQPNHSSNFPFRVYRW